MNKNKNLTITFSACEDEWMCPLVEEVLSHLDLPDEKETNLDIYDIDDRGMTMMFETYIGTDKDGDEEYNVFYGYLRYWIDEEWPDFCVSYDFYIDDVEKDSGAYQIVRQDGEDKCIPIED